MFLSQNLSFTNNLKLDGITLLHIYRYILCFKVWDDIINQASKNVDVLKDQEAVKQLGSILKTNVRACKALGHPFVSQLGRIYLDMLNVYKVCILIEAQLKCGCCKYLPGNTFFSLAIGNV